MELQMPSFQWTVSLNGLMITSAILLGIWKASRVVTAVIGPIRQFMIEHDVMWEDYSMRTGGKYRRAIGRGGAPEPEEFYERHPDALRKEDGE